jgi:site-specific DNA-cytosine methylase
MSAIPINGMTLNKQLRDKQMTGVGQEGDPMFAVRSSGQQHAVGFYSNQGSLGQGNNEELCPTLKAAESTNHAAVAYNFCGGSKREFHVRKTDVSACVTTKSQEPGETTQNSITAAMDVVAVDTYNQTTQETAIPIRSTASDICHTGGVINPAERMAVRRLTPRECERLQGFKDDHTLIPWRGKSTQDCPDGPRYKALGNSMAVPCMA